MHVETSSQFKISRRATRVHVLIACNNATSYERACSDAVTRLCAWEWKMQTRSSSAFNGGVRSVVGKRKADESGLSSDNIGDNERFIAKRLHSLSIGTCMCSLCVCIMSGR